MAFDFNYKWYLENSSFLKNKGKVFSCYACGGGSTMGYKLSGFDVIGMNEIDHRMADLYIKNHSPRYSFIEPIQTFKNRKDLPEELFHLDILDGSPPCSSFSMSGNRQADWGKEKKFKEGQASQVLDTLFFDFIDLAERLKPKVVIAENVTGILQGNARDYVRRILSAFDSAGYLVKEFKLNSGAMGVPQKRERVFFIGVRKDLQSVLPSDNHILFNDFPKLNLQFARDTISFNSIRYDGLNDASWTDHDQKIWNKRLYGDRKYSDVLERIENRHSNFNSCFIYDDRVVPTISASEGSKLTLFEEPRRMNSIEMILSQTFPLDYDFKTKNCSKIQYVLGMSVPPVMMANLSSRIYNEWKAIF